MAVPTNAYQRAEITHALEEIRDVIDDVSPWLTPFYTNAPKTSIENTHYEWHTDALSAASNPYAASFLPAGGTNNAWVDGEAFTAIAIPPTVRLSNHCQIQRKDIMVTRRARRINKAGQRDELARQVTRKGLELRRDMEATLLANQIAVADTGNLDGTAPPKLAGLPVYITGARANRGVGGADSTDPLNGTDAKDDGTIRALTESGILGVVQAIYQESQEVPNVILLDTKSKKNLSTYLFSSSARIATQYQDQGASPRGGVTVVGAVDVYVSDYATLDIVPDRFITERTAGGFDCFIYNTDYAECAAFDAMSTDVAAKRADSDDRMVIVDHTLCVRNPKAIGTFADINEDAAVTA